LVTIPAANASAGSGVGVASGVSSPPFTVNDAITLLEQGTCLVAARGHKRSVTVALEVAHDHIAHDRLIVDHKNRGHSGIVDGGDCVKLKSKA
jgi:hypothetical protein